ncbi:MAG: NADH-quinone oxidoreductase subunit A [Bacteroidetes bacterium]|nr:NADH-quinone oxidoreductase subunit A [Bacteroidota bacterium]MBS1744863.1 NADH-quinone oxidoreductase subunit A [Bacteroidota bacterium]
MENNNFSKKFTNTSLLMGLGIVALLLIIFWMNGIFSLLGGAGTIGVLVFIAFILGLIYFGQRWLLGGLKPKDIPNGLPATATVISCRQGSMSMSVGVNQNFQLIIEVNVSNPQGETWQTTMKEMINITQISVFQPGVQFAVKYDPNDKSKVVFDQSAPTQNQANQASNINKAMNNPSANYTNQDVLNAKQAAPTDIMQKVQYHSDLLKELLNTGTASTSTVINSEVALKDFMPGINILKVAIEVKNTMIDTFESDIFLIAPATSMHKFEPNDTVHILYDPKNPRRVCISGTDKVNSTVEI